MRLRLTLFTALLPAVAQAQSGVYDHRGTAGDEFGSALAVLGDLDGDGIDDYAVGAPRGDGLEPGAGYVDFISGASASS